MTTTATAAETLTFVYGCYPLEFKARTAGDYGCDPCLDCGQNPAAGTRIWMSSYGDLFCDPCARRRVAEYDPARWGTDEVPAEPETLTFVHGNWPSMFHRVSGSINRATDCMYCGPQVGGTVKPWHNPHGEQVCDACAKRLAGQYKPEEWRTGEDGTGGLKAGDVVRLDRFVTTYEVTAVYPDAGLVDLRGHASGEVAREVRVVVGVAGPYKGRLCLEIPTKRHRRLRDGGVDVQYSRDPLQVVAYPRYFLPTFGRDLSVATILRRPRHGVPSRRAFTVNPYDVGDWLEVDLGRGGDADRETVPAQVVVPATQNRPGWVLAMTPAGNELVQMNRHKNRVTTWHTVCGNDVRRTVDPFVQPQLAA